MPVPEGIISTSTGPVDPTEVVQEVVPVEADVEPFDSSIDDPYEKVQDDLPELP